MVAVFVIVFREILEVGLVVGIILTSTRGVAGCGWWIGVGIAAGVVGALITMGLADQIGLQFANASRQILNAAVLAVAVAMLGWTVVWLSVHSRRMAANVKQMGRDVAEGRRQLRTLAVVVGVAVLREGVEVVLFVYSTVAAGNLTTLDVTVGVGLGTLYGAAVTSVFYLGLGAIPLRHVFKVMSVLVTLLTAGLAAQAVGLLQSAGCLLPLSEQVWDTSHILRQGSILGRILHTLVGYVQRPTGLQIVAYGATIIAIVAALRSAERTRARRAAAARPATRFGEEQQAASDKLRASPSA